MKKLLAGITLTACAFSFSGCTKRVEDAGFRFAEYKKVLGPYWQVNDIQFADSQNGMMLVDYESVLRTSDGGNTWQSVFSDPATVTCIAYPQKDTAYVYVQPSSSADHDVFRSIDGGTTWTAVAPLADDVTVDFYNGKNGFAYAAIPPSNQERVLKTTNAGATWTTVGTQTFSALSNIQFVSATRGFVLYSDFQITTDGGLTWTPTRSVPNGWSHMSTEGVCYITYDNEIQKTTDFGATWSTCLTASASQLLSIDFYGQFVVALQDMQFVVSKDGGATWSNYLIRDLTYSYSPRLSMLRAIDGQSAMVTGRFSDYESTTVFKFTFP